MSEVSMPRLSDTMQEGTITRWLKKAGDAVKKGEVLAEIETDKANMEVESYESGILEQIQVDPCAEAVVIQQNAVVLAVDHRRVKRGLCKVLGRKRPAARVQRGQGRRVGDGERGRDGPERSQRHPLPPAAHPLPVRPRQVIGGRVQHRQRLIDIRRPWCPKPGRPRSG